MILQRSCKNPNKPNFNHYLFETITVLIRTSVAQNPGVLEQFEQILFPVFTPIFTDDVAEFVPYVLQIIGFLLESHKTGTIPETYRALFQSILIPSFWDRSGNIPALSRLLQAYIEKAGETIVLEKLVRFCMTEKFLFN
jgi:exportin-2 (importin alpha re-exporter)